MAAEHGIDPREAPPARPDPVLAEVGKQLIQPTALDCRQCHALGREPLAGDAKTQPALADVAELKAQAPAAFETGLTAP